MTSWWRRWQRRRRCFHGDPANYGKPGESGSSYVVALQMINNGAGKLWECAPSAGGCGRRWT